MVADTTGIILAGGKSSRMGENKAFVLFSNQPLVEILLDKVSALFKDLMIVSNKPHLYQKYGIRVEKDVFQDCGPLGGIYTGLFCSQNLHNFILACDMPFANQDLIRYMLEKSADSDVTIAEHNGRLEPLCAVYSKNCIQPVKEQLVRNNLKIVDFFKHVRVKTISEEEVARFDPEGCCFANINTPEDYHQSLKP